MPYLRDRVIVLKKEPFREHDRRYVMYGREHGLLVAVARGSSSGVSKQAGHLEPFSESEVMIARGVAFDKLAVARSLSYPTATPPLAWYAICGACADLVIALTRPGISDPRLFEILREAVQTLAVLPEEPSPERGRMLLATLTLHILDTLGFAPPIEKPAEGTSAVPSLHLVAFMRRSSLLDVLRVTAPIGVLNAASAFVEEALKETPLHREPHGPRTIQAICHIATVR